MAATPTGPDPQRPGSRPLSAQEQQALRELEARATAEDPGLSESLRPPPPRYVGLSPRAYNTAIQAAVVVVVALLVLPGPLAGAVLAIAVMLVPAVAYALIRRDER